MLIAATTVNKGVSKAKEVISENKYTIMGTIGTIGALGVAYFAFDRWKKNKDEQEANNAYGVDSKEGQAVRIATTIYNSLHTWGNPVFTFMSNTDEESIKGALKLMKLRGVPFSLVTAMYKKLYNRSLSTDLSKELDVDEKKEIDSIIYLKPSPVKINTDKSATTYAKVNSWNGEPLFKTVSDVYLPGFSYGREKIIHLKNDTHLGPLTGKQYKGFKQVSVMIGGKPYNVWVDGAEIIEQSAAETQKQLSSGASRQMSDKEKILIMNYFV